MESSSGGWWRIYKGSIKKVDKLGESLDILPTVLNLFGIEYDSRILMGTDLLSDNDGLVIFNDRSWITEKGKYNAATKKFTAYTDDIDDNYIETINQIVYNKYVISKNILDTDFGYTLSLINGKYKLIIIYWLANHKSVMRYNELKRCLWYIRIYKRV